MKARRGSMANILRPWHADRVRCRRRTPRAPSRRNHGQRL